MDKNTYTQRYEVFDAVQCEDGVYRVPEIKEEPKDPVLDWRYVGGWSARLYKDDPRFFVITGI